MVQSPETTSIPVTISTPAAGSTVNTDRPTFAGSGEPSAHLVVSAQNGLGICATLVSAAGSWSCTPSFALPHGPFTVTVHQQAQYDATTAERSFNILFGPLTISSPVAGSTIDTGHPIFVGGGTPSADLRIYDLWDGDVLCTTTVGVSGAWSCPSTVELSNGEHTVLALQVDPGGHPTTSELTFIVDSTD
ncbi:Ig-like domain-containing protein [Leifsonia sp. NPDC058230]|uniref:Ig-like domain-containing protein n=1 Tax=Leifsonia sp. NPDC058230 TaxID=3346391 RepID=UPI0036DF4E61